MAGERSRGASAGPDEQSLPIDLVAVVVLTGLALGVVFVPELQVTPFRFVLGLLFVAFLPGYAVVAAVFPERNEPGDRRRDARSERATGTESYLTPSNWSIDKLERVVLSVGVSVVGVALAGMLLNYTARGIRPAPLAAALTAITVGATVIATVRRWRLPEGERFRVPFRGWIGGAYAGLTGTDSRTDTVLNAVIVVAALITVSSLAYAAVVPHDGEQFTELYLLTEEDDGGLVADGYPEEFTAGESHTLTVGIGNHEHETVEYSLVVELQQVESDGEEMTVVERERLDQQVVSLSHNETTHHELDLVPETAGDEQRLAVMLFRDDPPDEPALEDAYRSVNLRVDVVGEDADEDDAGDPSSLRVAA